MKNLKSLPRNENSKVSRGNVKGTSVARTLHVKSSLIRHKIFRSCFLCTIVQFTDVLTNDDIITLTRDFFFTPEITLFRQLIAIHFKHVTFQVHSANGAFRYTTLAVSVEYTNPGHHKHGCQPELWIHSEVNVGADCSTQIKHLSTKLKMLRLSYLWIFSQFDTSIYTLEG